MRIPRGWWPQRLERAVPSPGRRVAWPAPKRRYSNGSDWSWHSPLPGVSGGLSVEIGIEYADFGDLRDGQLVAGRRAPDSLWRRSVVDAVTAPAVGRDIGMDPGHAILGVVFDDLPAQAGTRLVLRDVEALGKFSFDQVAAHARDLPARWKFGRENCGAADFSSNRQNYPFCTADIPRFGAAGGTGGRRVVKLSACKTVAQRHWRL